MAYVVNARNCRAFWAAADREIREERERRELHRDRHGERDGRLQDVSRLRLVVCKHHQRDAEEVSVAEAEFFDDISADNQKRHEEHLSSPGRQAGMACDCCTDVPEGGQFQREEHESRELQRQPSERDEQHCDSRRISEALRWERPPAIRLGWIQFEIAGEDLARRPVIDGEVDGLGGRLVGEEHEKGE
jgi:hypothetical protein